MSNIELKCSNCGTSFLRRKAEYNRSYRKGRKAYCSRKCQGKHCSYNNLPKDSHNKYKLTIRVLDEYSQFRSFMKTCKQRNKEVSITLQDLKNQWEKQNGVCPYTGWKLKTSISERHRDSIPMTPDKASLDRIDSSKGYEVGNIEFVSLMAQFAKNSWNREDVINFGKAIYEYSSVT